ncbi:MAG: hypothetical protein IKH92_05580 [Clostridiales bacterium]|nr:hypothetical protein [Clostridiales bacterium]
MDMLKGEMIARKLKLEAAMKTAQKQILEAPEGRLRIDNSKGTPRYYQVSKKYSNGRFIPEKEIETAKKLAQKDYAKHFMALAQREINCINGYFREVDKENAEFTFLDLKDFRRILVSPLLLDSKTFAEKWSSLPFDSNPNYVDGLIYPTKRGELVRSKTEVFIANTYYELGIPYRYECAMRLKNGALRYPDFTTLDQYRHQVVYHEHFGLIEDAGYRRAAMKKISEYSKSGIFIGKNLILTFETEYEPFDPELFRENVMKIYHVGEDPERKVTGER